jgi:hypothetical protein
MGTLAEQRALAGVARERCSALELRAGLVEAAELSEEVTAHAGHEVVAPERGLLRERIHELETRGRTEGHRDCDRAIQLHDGRWHEPGKRFVKRDNARPVRFLRGMRQRMTGGDGSLKCVCAPQPAELIGAFEGGKTTTDEKLVPESAVLVEKENRFA